MKRAGYLCVIAALAAIALSHSIAAAPTKEVRRILILNETNPTYPGTSIINQGIQTALNNSPYHLEFYSEHMDTGLFPDPAVQQEFRDSYIRKYQNRKLDVIITVGPSPLKFMQEVHQRAFPGVPIVFCLPTLGVPGAPTLDSDFTGVENDMAPVETVGIALRLLPGTKNVVVVGGVGPFDREQLATVKKDLKAYEGRVDISYLTDLAMPDLLERLRHLPSNAVVLLTSVGADAAGTSFKSNELGPLVAGAANAPVFGLFDVYLNHGEVGGYLSSLSDQGKVAGGMALRILRGEKPQDLPMVKGVNTYMFDWRALKRWGLKESALPPDSIVLNRQPTVWESYKAYITGAISLILLEALLIGGLVWQRAGRLKSEKALRASEERLRLAQQAARIGTFDWNIRTGVNIWTPELEAMYGLPPGGFGGTHTAFENLVHPDDRAAVIKLVDAAMKSGQPTKGEWRVVWADGSVHWIAGRWQVFMDASGKPSKIIGVNIDITERKRAEEAMREMNRALEGKNALLQSREELLKIFVKNVPAAVAMLDRDMRYLQVSNRWCSDNSVEASELLGRSRELSPEMPDRWKEVNRRALQGETLRADEDRWESGGRTRWARWEVRPWRAADGTVGGILILTEDITRSKEAEETLSDMTRKLIEAQEQERARIGRELHDDVNQRLAMLSLELEQLQENPSEVQRRVQELRNQTTELSNDVQAMSHDLHSSKLEYLGVVAGIKSWCKEFGERQRVEIDFSNDVHSALPFEIGRSLFRVLQEALHNATKHSGVKRIEVQLREDSGEIHLIIRDSGKGFDVEAALQGKGLGLTSMRERVRLVKGTLSIDSQSKRGTTIHARVPLEWKQDSQRKAV